jgi:hypothetical protein
MPEESTVGEMPRAQVSTLHDLTADQDVPICFAKVSTDDDDDGGKTFFRKCNQKIENAMLEVYLPVN